MNFVFWKQSKYLDPNWPEKSSQAHHRVRKNSPGLGPINPFLLKLAGTRSGQGFQLICANWNCLSTIEIQPWLVANKGTSSTSNWAARISLSKWRPFFFLFFCWTSFAHVSSCVTTEWSLVPSSDLKLLLSIELSLSTTGCSPLILRIRYKNHHKEIIDYTYNSTKQNS